MQKKAVRREEGRGGTCVGTDERWEGRWDVKREHER